MKKDDKDSKTQNRGVSVTSEDLLQEESQSENLENVRDHLQNVIDMMGPETPHFRFTTTATSTECMDADNEESYYESTSIISSVVQIKQTPKAEPPGDSTQECSELSAFPPDSDKTEVFNIRTSTPPRQRPPIQPYPFQPPSMLAVPCGPNHPYACQCSRDPYGLGYNYFPSPVPQPTTMQGSPPRQPYNYSEREQYQIPREKNKRSIFGYLKKDRFVKRKEEPMELYKMNIAASPKDGQSPPRRLVFDLVDAIPKPQTNTTATNTCKYCVKTFGTNTCKCAKNFGTNTCNCSRTLGTTASVCAKHIGLNTCNCGATVGTNTCSCVKTFGVNTCNCGASTKTVATHTCNCGAKTFGTSTDNSGKNAATHICFCDKQDFGISPPGMKSFGVNVCTCTKTTGTHTCKCMKNVAVKGDTGAKITGKRGLSRKCMTCEAKKRKGGLFEHGEYPSSIVVAHNDPYPQMKSSRKVYYSNSIRTEKSDGVTDTRMDVYYFDHGNCAYYCTTDSPPLIMTEILAEKTEHYATKFWAEIFGTIYIGFAFFTSFILQLLRFLLYSVVRPLTVGVIQLASDYFFKPCLAVTFNGIVQPPLICCYNVATSLRDLFDPIAEGLGYFLRELATLFRAIRFCDYNVVKTKKYPERKSKHTCTDDLAEDERQQDEKNECCQHAPEVS